MNGLDIVNSYKKDRELAIQACFSVFSALNSHLPERNPQKSTLLREKQREKNFIGMATT